MSTKAVFEGLIFDENDNPVGAAYVGNEATYVVDDDGFLRHIPSEHIDKQILDYLKNQVLENKDLLTDQTAKMLGQEDIFTRAVIENQLEGIDQQMDMLLNIGLSPSNREYLGMIGFRIRINIHGDILEIVQPEAGEGD
ncbi:MAG TPA: hypothetical protein DCK95_10070 [Anaerolineaceae bacterium]|uniref:Uncharacterized protein n=1 Tax=Anaerolinea thermophila TaxID=167964 RepID=A0A117LGU8_9CHLR|nr:MAG: hypothetical protein XD73_0646 [Anaerolinea thermophila]HAF62655.1 hypothetical protein [Anaerolineaceae bacterium]